MKLLTAVIEAEAADYGWKVLTEFGVVVFLLLVCVGCMVYGAYWLAQNAVKPWVSSQVNYVSNQTDIARKSQEAISEMAVLERDIRTAIEHMKEAHADHDSVFATVHTNAGIEILAKAVARIASKLDISVDDLVLELTKHLSRQKQK